MSLISEGEYLINVLNDKNRYESAIYTYSENFIKIKSFVLEAVRSLKGREVSRTAVLTARKMLQQYREEQHKLYKGNNSTRFGFAPGSAHDEQIAGIQRTLDGALDSIEHKEPAPAADTLTFQDSSIGAFSGTSNFTSEPKASAHAQPLPEPREAISAFSYLISLKNALIKEGILLDFTISSYYSGSKK